MNLVDFLAFVAAMIFMIVSSRQVAKRRKEQSTDDSLAEPELLAEDLIGGEKQAEARQPLPSYASRKESREKHWSPKVEKKAAAYKHSNKEAYQKEMDTVFSEIKQPSANAYTIVKRDTSSKALHLVQQLKSKKQIAVLHDIFGRPKGL